MELPQNQRTDDRTLHRRRGGANGIYRCYVPGRTKSHELFVGVYAANSGRYSQEMITKNLML